MSPCPICACPAAPREQNRAFPFCSQRCKLVDLGKWLDGKYAVPDDDATDSNADEESA